MSSPIYNLPHLKPQSTPIQPAEVVEALSVCDWKPAADPQSQTFQRSWAATDGGCFTTFIPGQPVIVDGPDSQRIEFDGPGGRISVVAPQFPTCFGYDAYLSETGGQQ